MAIKEKEVLISINNRNKKIYENKGYKIKEGTKILVKVEDLSKGNQVKVTKICDICGCEVPQAYCGIIKSRNNNKDELDKCHKCSAIQAGKINAIANDTNCVAITHPEFVKLFWNKKDTFKYKYRSGKRADFKCPQCGNKIENKLINNIFKRGVSCYCDDGKFYPEKFMYSLLDQLNMKFETEKIFDWSKYVNTSNLFLNGAKKYDFYLNELNIIVETHGKQHYEENTFNKLNGKTLILEQENDRIKKQLAEENGIICISIDCRKSEMEFIKEKIEESPLKDLFDLSNIDWLKCHEFACSSLVLKVSDLWNEGESVKIIADKLQICLPTIRKYLKQGNLLGRCNYDPIEEKIKNSSKNGKKSGKPIIQLSLNGEFIREWESIAEAKRKLGKGFRGIQSACISKGNTKTAGGFQWMFKEDYFLAKDLNKELIYKKWTNPNKKPIIQLSLNGEFIREWKSVLEAKKSIKKGSSHISSVLTGKRKKAGGFKWKYKEDYVS